MIEENHNQPFELRPGEWVTYNVTNLPIFAQNIIVELSCPEQMRGHSFDICVEGDVGASWSQNNVTFFEFNRRFLPEDFDGNLNWIINRIKVKLLNGAEGKILLTLHVTNADEVRFLDHMTMQ